MQVDNALTVFIHNVQSSRSEIPPAHNVPFIPAHPACSCFDMDRQSSTPAIEAALQQGGEHKRDYCFWYGSSFEMQTSSSNTNRHTKCSLAHGVSCFLMIQFLYFPVGNKCIFIINVFYSEKELRGKT